MKSALLQIEVLDNFPLWEWKFLLCTAELGGKIKSVVHVLCTFNFKQWSLQNGKGQALTRGEKEGETPSSCLLSWARAKPHLCSLSLPSSPLNEILRGSGRLVLVRFENWMLSSVGVQGSEGIICLVGHPYLWVSGYIFPAWGLVCATVLEFVPFILPWWTKRTVFTSDCETLEAMAEDAHQSGVNQTCMEETSGIYKWCQNHKCTLKCGWTLRYSARPRIPLFCVVELGR